MANEWLKGVGPETPTGNLAPTKETNRKIRKPDLAKQMPI